MEKTNFDLYLEEELRDANFAERFERAGEAWDVALQTKRIPKETGISQKRLAGVREESAFSKATRRRSVRR